MFVFFLLLFPGFFSLLLFEGALPLPLKKNNDIIIYLSDVEGFLKTDDRMRLAKERREERERSLGKKCLRLFFLLLERVQIKKHTDTELPFRVFLILVFCRLLFQDFFFTVTVIGCVMLG